MIMQDLRAVHLSWENKKARGQINVFAQSEVTRKCVSIQSITIPFTVWDHVLDLLHLWVVVQNKF